MRNKLRAYSKRGVFRGFSERPGRTGQTIYEFTWMDDATFTLVADAKRGALISSSG